MKQTEVFKYKLKLIKTHVTLNCGFKIKLFLSINKKIKFINIPVKLVDYVSMNSPGQKYPTFF